MLLCAKILSYLSFLYIALGKWRNDCSDLLKYATINGNAVQKGKNGVFTILTPPLFFNTA